MKNKTEKCNQLELDLSCALAKDDWLEVVFTCRKQFAMVLKVF